MLHRHTAPLTTLLLAALLPVAALAQTSGDEPMGQTLAAATADRTAAGCPPMRFSNLQRRVLNAADRGEQSLRSFVTRTRMTNMLDLEQTILWVDQVRGRNADCRTVITAMAP
jgi:hypothetical protein